MKARGGAEAKPQEKSEPKLESAGQVQSPIKSTTMDEEKSNKPIQEDKNKCYHCKKKAGIYGFECKCGYTFCKMHRIPEDHDCTFDFAHHGKKQLEKNNPLLVGKKLEEL